ncbi:MAG: 4Fe-4S dicluster domain-containing protein [Gemmatimonadota bacterium]
MTRPAFQIDLARCTGCLTCRIACRDRADLPDGVDWLRIEAQEGGAFPAPTLTYRVVHCFHCAEPACVPACPEQGITRGADGLVRLDREACTACGQCAAACPFGAIALGPDGAATKCDGCPEEVAAGWEPTCVRACPMRALGFGPDRPRPGRVPDGGFDDAGLGPAVSYWKRPPAAAGAAASLGVDRRPHGCPGGTTP